MAEKSPQVKGTRFQIKRRGVTATCELPMGELNRKLPTAQYMLDSQVMADMVPFMPLRTGNFIQRTTAESAAMAGTGYVCAAAAPFGRFLYEGKTMVDPVTGSPWARRGAAKVLVSNYKGKTNAREYLTYLKSANPNAQSQWFEAAKNRHGKEWRRMVGEILGGR